MWRAALYTVHTRAYLLPRVRWKVEHEHGEEGDADAGDDDVDRVEEGLPPQRQVKDDVKVRLRAAGIVLLVAHRRGRHDVPLGGEVELLQVHSHLYPVVAAVLVDVPQVHHVTVVCPAPELHEAFLLVEGEELHVDLTGGLVDCRRVPGDLARIVQNRLGHDCDFIVAVSTEKSVNSRESPF